MRSEGSIEIDGFKLKYHTEGSGPDVVVIGSSIYYPRSFSQNLRKFLRLHFVDYREFAEGPQTELTFDTLLDDLDCKDSFLKGYASIRKVPDYKPMMPLLRLSRAVAAVGFTVKRGTWESRNSKLYQFSLSHLESLWKH